MRPQKKSAGASGVKHFFGPIYFVVLVSEITGELVPVSWIEDKALGDDGTTGAGDGVTGDEAMGAGANCFCPTFFKKSTVPWSLACKWSCMYPRPRVST